MSDSLQKWVGRNRPPRVQITYDVEIDRDNFNDVMTKIAPRLDISVPDTLKGEGNLKVELHFNQIDQFEPESIVNQIPRLARLLEARQQLRDLLGKLDGNDELDALLENILQNTEDLKQLKGSTEASDGETAEAAA